MDFNDETGEPKKKRPRIIHRAVKPTVGAQFRGVDSGTVKKVLLILLIGFIMLFSLHLIMNALWLKLP